ncbi:HEC/Ndc80p family-domain-containing protein [Gautieria morchelliformis]|nr:HEC/Ndc80p family-domain-containing protein [Gautieria morchelliformis]
MAVGEANIRAHVTSSSRPPSQEMERRQTLHPIAVPAESARSGIPMPASTIKATQMARTAGPPGASRTSMFGSQPGLPNPRQSMMRAGLQNIDPSTSVRKPGDSTFGRTPMSAKHSRRGGVGRASMAPTAAMTSMSQSVKDNRPIRDKQFQILEQKQILKFLAEAQFPGNITMKTLQSPTSKDFQTVFRWLFEILDPCYVLCKGNKKFDDEIIPTLKYHRYPAADQINIKWMQAVGSMHAWPSMLAVLHWMTLLCLVKTSYASSDDPTVQNKGLVPEFFGEEHNNTLAFEYYVEAYDVFLQGSDDFSVQDQELEDRYAKRNQAILHERDQLKEELRQLQKEYDLAMATPAPVVKLKLDNSHLKKDQMKFTSVISHHRSKVDKYKEAVKTLHAEIMTQESNLQKMREEYEHFSRTVREQNLSPQEVARMNSEHDNLHRTLGELRRKVAETQQTYHSLEVALANRTADMEKAVDEYMGYLWRLELHPQPPPPVSHINFELTFDVAKDDPKQLVSGEDLKVTIIPALTNLASQRRQERGDAEDEAIQVDFNMDRLVTECENLEEAISNVEVRMNVLSEQADALRKAAQDDAFMSNTEATRLERELAQARAAAKSSGVGVKLRVQALEIAYQEQIEKTDRLRDETVKAIVKSTNDMCVFKEQVSEHLSTLRQFAEEN